MPRRPSYEPKHRAVISAAPAPSSTETSASAGVRGVRRSLSLSATAVAATALAVSSGVLLQGRHADPAVSATLAAAPATSASPSTPATHTAPVLGASAGLGDRTRSVSRSVARTAVAPQKARALSQASGGQVTKTEDLTTGDPRIIARAMLAQFGYGADQFSCLDSIYTNESGWNVHADNPSSSAYGIPQALPGAKMASAGADWATNPATQIRWGLGYIRDRYGSPCSAWGFKQGHGWY